MKDVKQKAVAPTPQDDGGTEARFADVCKSALDLDESTAKEAIDLFRKCKPFLLGNLSALGSGSPEEFECYWTAFVLYCIVKLKDGRPKVENGEARLNLSLILRAAKVNAVGFFREMPYFLLKAGHILGNQYGSDWERRLEVKEAQANFVHLKLLSDYYRRAYKEFFLPRCMGDGNHCANPGNIGFVSEYHRFGWFLFLALRIHAFSSFKDLVTCTHGLISILAILILHVPISLRKFSVLDSSRLVKKSDKGVELLASLCDTCHTSEDDLRTAMEKTNCLIVEILKKKPHPASECQAETLANINKDGLTYFEDLLEENSLQQSLLILEKDYADAVDRKGELDERLFVDDEDSLLGTGSLSGGAVDMHSSKHKFDKMVSPTKAITSKLSPPRSPATPVKGNSIGSTKMAPTPVSTAMTTAKWLRTIISPLMSKPSTELEHFLSSCNSDVTRHVILRANIILEAIFPSSFRDQSVAEASQGTSMKDGIWAEQRKMEAMKLYYRVLETMCRAESQMLNGNNLTSLLSNDRFHRCMLACCAELVLATHKTVSMMFPAVLERSGITAFDLSKVIESFIRHEESLPRELKRHLNSLEERLLESMAWEKGSSLYNSLIVARPSLSAEINHLGLLAEPMPSLDAVAMRHSIHSEGLTHLPLPKREISSDHNVDIRSPKRVCTELQSTLVEHKSFNSPVKEHVPAFNSPRSKLPPLQSAFASPTWPNPAGSGETCGETGISVFFSKIVKLAAIRIRSLSEMLQLSHQVQECVYYLIQQILNQRTFLFFNRHIDQLILCCFYGVAKISQLPLTFKEIINCYRKQSHCKAQVYRSVFVDWSSTRHSERTGQDHVDIITFYNKVFIPSVKPLLVELGPAGSKLPNNQPPDDCSSADGPPQLSPFPSLPDMSPKKVSATHNVYVSPLRTSKMDSLLSPSSKSYYACVGESTHAYQSPSKDLTAINNRLNSGRKVRLNFDVVSDSLVAGSLCSQNSSSSSSPAAVGASHPVVKHEQLDF